MSILNLFRRLKRPHWHLCYDCMRQNNLVAEGAIFFNDGPPNADYLGRPHYRCPRCRSLNTRTFQFLKEGGEEAALSGLERIVKANPRSRFQVAPRA
ncbi:MAG: hypothetical protein ACE5I7_16555 [Candidatus Binatia bacterium]